MAVLRALAEQGCITFSVEDARATARDLGISDTHLVSLLHRLARFGFVQRLKRGSYALGPGLPGVARAHPFAVAMALVEPCAVSGYAALNHHGLTEQIPRMVTLTTPKRVVTPAMRGAIRAAPSTWTAAGQTFEIVVVVPAHFFGDEEVWIGNSRARIFDRERALLDCFALPRRFGGIAEGLGILEEHLHELDVERLVAHAVRYGKIAVAKRVGFALENAGAGSAVTEPLASLPMKGYRPLDPTRSREGRRSAQWGLVVNLAASRKR